MKMKRIILCADDYGQNSAISQAIINLIKEKRLSATSCMTTGQDWIVYGQWLKPFQHLIDVGLHFNLTEGRGQSLNALIIKAYLRKLNQLDIEKELHHQLDQFELGLGRLPDFVDGHQHVHQLPIIRDALFTVYEKRLRQSGCYIRCTTQRTGFWNVSAHVKLLIIQLCGAFALKSALLQRKIPHNSSFSGIYNFAKAKDFSRIFPRFLQDIQDRGLIMCHPGVQEHDSLDKISQSRFQEYQYFLSSEFNAECLAKQIALCRFGAF